MIHLYISLNTRGKLDMHPEINILSICMCIAAILNLGPIIQYKKYGPRESNLKVKKRALITTLILLPWLFLVALLVSQGYKEKDDELINCVFLLFTSIFLQITALINWYIYLKKEKPNTNETNSKKQWREKRNAILVVTIASALTLCVAFNGVFIDNFTKVYYRFSHSKIEEVYERDYLSTMEDQLQTEKLPDVTVDLADFKFVNMWMEDVPFYKAKYEYSSQCIDKYYDDAMKSKKSAKKLYDAILEVNSSKNKYQLAKDYYREYIKYDDKHALISSHD